MELPDFPLAPWEVPPDSDIPLVAPADAMMRAFWRGRETELLMRGVELDGQERLFFREVGSDEVGNWLMFETGSAKAQREIGEQTYESELRFSPRICWRHFYFDGARYGAKGTHNLVVADGGGQIYSPTGCVGFDLPKWGEQFYQWRAAQIGRWMRGELKRPDSDVRFAFGWLGLTESERQSLVFGISPDQLEQMKRLMRYVLHSDKLLQNELWSNPEYSQYGNCAWTINCPDSSSENSRSLASLMLADEIYSENYEPHFHGYDEDDYLQMMPERFAKWRRIFTRHFGPFSDEETLRRIYNIHDYGAKSIRVTAKMPTAHEQLESVVALREWFCNVYAPREFADLMES